MEAMMDRRKCAGLAGKIFGHSFTTAYNEDESGLVAEQMKEIVSFAKNENLCPPDIRHLITSAVQRTSIIKVVYCARCGEIKATNGNGTTAK